MSRFLKLRFVVSFFSFLFVANLEAEDTSGSSNYRERFSKVPTPERGETIEEGKEDGGGDGGGGSKGGKSRKKKKKKDDFKRIPGLEPYDPIAPVTGVKTGDLTAVTYKSPTPTAPLLEKAWNSTAWAPTYQPASRSLLGKKGNLEAVIQSDLIKHTGWKVDGDSISTPPDLSGTPYDTQTGQAIGSSGGVFGVIGRAASALTWDNPFSVFGPYNPFKLVRKNPLKNPYGIVQSGRRLANYAGVLSAWTFGEGIQITENGGLGIIHNPSGGEALWAGAGIALWFTPIKAFRPVLSAGARVLPKAAQAWGTATALGRGAWARVSGLSQRAWGQVSGLSQRTWERAGHAWQTTNDFLRSWGLGYNGAAGCGPGTLFCSVWNAAKNRIPIDILTQRARDVYRRFHLGRRLGIEVDDFIHQVYITVAGQKNALSAARDKDSYLYIAAHRVALKAVTRGRGRHEPELRNRLADPAHILSAREASPDPLTKIVKEADETAVTRAIERAYAGSSESTKRVADFYLGAVERYKTVTDFARSIGLDRTTVAHRMARFRDRVKKELESVGIGPDDF